MRSRGAFATGPVSGRSTSRVAERAAAVDLDVHAARHEDRDRPEPVAHAQLRLGRVQRRLAEVEHDRPARRASTRERGRAAPSARAAPAASRSRGGAASACALPVAGRSATSGSSSPCVTASSARSTRPANSSSVSRPATVASRSSAIVRSRSASPALTATAGRRRTRASRTTRRARRARPAGRSGRPPGPSRASSIAAERAASTAQLTGLNFATVADPVRRQALLHQRARQERQRQQHQR